MNFAKNPHIQKRPYISVVYVLLLLIFSEGFFPLPAFAAIRNSQLMGREGVLRGGSADGYMSLLNLRRYDSNDKKIERVVMDWGNQVLAPVAKGGYYTVEYKEARKGAPARILIVFALTMNTHFDAQKILKKIGNGVFVKSASLNFDSLSQSEVLTLSLRQPVHIKVSSSDQPARMAIDLFK